MDGKRNVENQNLSEVCLNGFEHRNTRIEAGALASVVQLIGSLSHALEGYRFNPGQGTYPDFKFKLTWGAYRRKPINISLSLVFLSPLSLSLSKITYPQMRF